MKIFCRRVGFIITNIIQTTRSRQRLIVEEFTEPTLVNRLSLCNSLPTLACRHCKEFAREPKVVQEADYRYQSTASQLVLLILVVVAAPLCARALGRAQLQHHLIKHRSLAQRSPLLLSTCRAKHLASRSTTPDNHHFSNCTTSVGARVALPRL